MRKSDIVDIEVIYKTDTDKALVVWADEDQKTEDRVIFLPKSQVELSDPNPIRGKVVTVSLPEWLATEKDLV